MKYIVVVEEGPESYGAYAPDLPGCAVIGESRGEVSTAINFDPLSAIKIDPPGCSVCVLTDNFLLPA